MNSFWGGRYDVSLVPDVKNAHCCWYGIMYMVVDVEPILNL